MSRCIFANARLAVICRRRRRSRRFYNIIILPISHHVWYNCTQPYDGREKMSILIAKKNLLRRVVASSRRALHVPAPRFDIYYYNNTITIVVPISIGTE